MSRIVYHGFEEKAIKLCFWELICPLLFNRILCCKNDKGGRKWKCLSGNRYLSFLHRLKESGLNLGWSTINLIREEEISKDWSTIRVEFGLRLIVHLSSCKVSWKEIGRELNTCRVNPERTRNRLNGQGFGKSRNSFEEDVATRK